MRACGAGSRAGSREVVHYAEGGYPGPGGNRRRVASDRAAHVRFRRRFLRGVVGLRRASAERFPQDQRRAYGERRCRWHGGGRLDDVAERGVRARLARIGRAWERFLLVRRAEEQRVRVLQRLRRPSHHRARLYGGQRGAGVFRHRRGVLEIRGLPMERGFRQRHHDVGAARTAGYRGRAGRERARMGSWTARRQGDRERRRNRDVCRAACCGRSIRRSARGVSGEVVNEPVARKRGAASRGKPFGHGAERRKGLERPGEPHSRSFVGVRHRLRCCLRAAARLGAARLLQVRTRIPAPVYRRVLARRA